MLSRLPLHRGVLDGGDAVPARLLRLLLSSLLWCSCAVPSVVSHVAHTAAASAAVVCVQATRETLTRDYQAWLQSAQLADVSREG
jgi:hypothetical protein